jgi:hypothetical protein
MAALDFFAPRRYFPEIIPMAFHFSTGDAVLIFISGARALQIPILPESVQNWQNPQEIADFRFRNFRPMTCIKVDEG